MDYFSVTQTAFLSATCMTLTLIFLLFRLSLSHRWVWPFVLGYTVQFFWLLSISLSYSSYLVSSTSSLLLEATHYLSWFFTLAILLNGRSRFTQWPLFTKLIAGFIILIATAAIGLLLTTSGKTAYLSASFALTAGLLLIFTEQTMRNIGSVRLIKLLGLCLLGQFIFDAYLYGQMAFSYSLGIGLWQTRAAIAFVTALAVSLGTLLFTDHKEHQQVSVSRPVVFYTTSAVISLIVFGILSLGAFYVRELDGYIGSYLFTLALISSLLLVSALAFSRRLKSSIEVFISKHFFNLKYDYREQWLNTITTTAKITPGQASYYEDILAFICNTFNSQAGALWLNQKGQLNLTAQQGLVGEIPNFTDDQSFIKPMLQYSWIYSPLSDNGAIAKHNQKLPKWLTEQALWMVCPMICNAKLLGVIAISKPTKSAQVTFEDRDLMTNLIDQISSQILLYQQEAQISESKQMETYNRLSAFIMHDVNNVIAQLALIVRNAEKHKTNPAFIDDMVKTVNNSVERMHGLVQKFKPESAEAPVTIMASDLLIELEKVCADREPKPKITVTSDFAITADKQKIILAVKNLIRNAQDATPNDGVISMTAQQDKDTRLYKIIIEDNGEGMSADFINSELFRPFSTTKEESGVGIGAHLTRSYIEHIGAKLMVESNLGSGSRFSIVFN